MPIYEFECKDCNKLFDITLRSWKELKGLVLDCPKCKSKNTKKVISQIGACWVMGYNSKNGYSKKQTEHR